MSNSMRWRWGETNPVTVDVPSTTSISMGDLVYLDDGAVKPASAFTFGANLAATQSGFRAKFLGVAMQAKPAGPTGKIRIATSGAFQFTCASAQFAFGAFVAPAANSSGNKLEDQKVVAVTNSRCAVGRVIRAESANVENVYIQIASTILTGGLTIDAESVPSTSSSSQTSGSN